MYSNEWNVVPLATIAEVRNGIAKSNQNTFIDPVQMPYLRVANVQDGYLDLSEIKTITVEKSESSKYALCDGDVLFTEGGDADKLGRGTVWKSELHECLHQNHIFVVRVHKNRLLPSFLSALAASSYGKSYFLKCSKQSTNLASINSSQLKAFPVLLPSIDEQRAIVNMLATWDHAIDLTTQLISAKQQRKRGLMQQLLTGRRRLKRFVGSETKQNTEFGLLPSDWHYLSIGEIARQVSERNTEGIGLPVLSCTKYSGLVDSLSYFGRQIFSEDTSAYKVVRRHQFAYATNHIEEGSIGYQDLYDEALISPMYTVFETDSTVDDHFLYGLLKTEMYRQIFERSTSASVDRRGSLRWNEFSHIKVPLPSILEQKAIAEVLGACDKELALLNRKLALLKKQKQGLMQQLLTGKVRVKT